MILELIGIFIFIHSTPLSPIDVRYYWHLDYFMCVYLI